MAVPRSPHPGLLLLLLLGCLAPAGSCVAGTAVEPQPRLVLLLAVDQLRPDRLDGTLPGGLGRLVQEGRRYERAVLAHAHSETCPGHACMLTGRHPGPVGIPSNSFIERDTMRLRYCVHDPDPDASSFGGTGVGRSPRNLRATTLGDWMKGEHPTAKVFAVSAKDRSAIMLGGQRPDGVYWLDWKGRGRFTTSRYYVPALPDWVDRWTRDRILDGIPDEWRHPSGTPPNGTRPDSFPGEMMRFSSVSPHPLPGPLPGEEAVRATEELELTSTNPEELVKQSLATLYFSPFVDEVTLRFARELVEREEIGTDDVPDLLAISLSGTDLVGHLYGPFSQESRDALLRLDLALAIFIDFLEQRVGKGRLLVALTSDHGVLPLPEWLSAQGEATCSVPGGRVGTAVMLEGLRAALNEQLGSPLSAGRENEETAGAKDSPAEDWLMREGYRLTVNRPLAAERGVEPSRVVAVAADFLRGKPGIAALWTPESIAASTSDTARLYRNSHDTQRGGDLIVEPEAGCLFSDTGEGTTHGSPHPYDREIPLLLFGPGVRPGKDTGPAASVDLGPTLAAMLGIGVPGDLDGKVLPLR